MIRIKKQDENTFEVTVQEDGDSSTHAVTVADDYYEKLTGGEITREELVARSFEFLLEREPKEAILSRFALEAINTYFPEYEDEITT